LKKYATQFRSHSGDAASSMIVLVSESTVSTGFFPCMSPLLLIFEATHYEKDHEDIVKLMPGG